MFKSNDISQMIYIHPNKEKFIEEVPNYQKVAKKVVEQVNEMQTKTKYYARDGLTPPTKCIRTRYFRKSLNIPPGKMSEIEEEMCEILEEIKKNKGHGGGDGSHNQDGEDDNQNDDNEGSMDEDN